jgi:hypothetical protein
MAYSYDLRPLFPELLKLSLISTTTISLSYFLQMEGANTRVLEWQN